MDSDILYHDFNKYQLKAKISQGSFGKVYKVLERETKVIYIAKKIAAYSNPFKKDVLSTSALTEIKILQTLDHENILNYIEICFKNKKGVSRATKVFYIIFEYCDYDLASIIRSGETLHTSEIKNIMKQLFSALNYIHSNSISHGDLRPDNVLLNKRGVVKLADFGIVKSLSEDSDNSDCATRSVDLLWYSAPEGLLGETNDDSSMDIWALGCIMAEFWTKSAIMQGASVVEQLSLITKMCGSITADVWPNVTKLDHFNLIENFPAYVNQTLKTELQNVITNEEAMDLLEKLLVLDPAKRLEASKAFYHDFFFKNRLPSSSLTRLMSNLKKDFRNRPSTVPESKPKP